jgi:hypothetical protein
MRALMNGSDENVRSERFKLFFFPLVAKDKKNAFRVTVKIFGLCAHFLGSSAVTFEGLPLWKKKKRTRERKRRYETRTVKLFVFVVLFSRKEERRL